MSEGELIITNDKDGKNSLYDDKSRLWREGRRKNQVGRTQSWLSGCFSCFRR